MTIPSEPIRDVRCKWCRRVLLQGAITSGGLTVKCPRCKQVSTFCFSPAVQSPTPVEAGATA